MKEKYITGENDVVKAHCTLPEKNEPDIYISARSRLIYV